MVAYLWFWVDLFGLGSFGNWWRLSRVSVSRNGILRVIKLVMLAVSGLYVVLFRLGAILMVWNLMEIISGLGLPERHFAGHCLDK